MNTHKIKVVFLVLIFGLLILNIYFLLQTDYYLNSCPKSKESASIRSGDIKDTRTICSNSICQLPDASCVVENGTAICKCPDCSSDHAPVCGSNDITYQNECHLRQDACRSNTSIQVLYNGLCRYKEECLFLMDHIDELNSKCSKCNCEFVKHIEDESTNNIWQQRYGSEEQDHPLVIKYLIEHHIFPIPERNPLIPIPKGDDSDMKEFIQPLFKKFKSGFFIESGANDGVYLSNTLALERDHNWTGLLIEPNPIMWPKIRLSNRRTWLANVGLSRYSYPEKIDFLHRIGDKKWFQGMGLTNRENDDRLNNLPNNYVSLGSVPCFTLYSILKAIRVEKVDFLSLDIEGLELDVLKNYPFDKIPIKVILAEVNLIPGGVGQFEDLLISNGYVRIFTKKVNRIYGHINYLDELEYK